MTLGTYIVAQEIVRWLAIGLMLVAWVTAGVLFVGRGVRRTRARRFL